jgi:hypothetical protein
MKATKVPTQKPESSVKKPVTASAPKPKTNFAKSFAKAAADVASEKQGKASGGPARKPASVAKKNPNSKKPVDSKYKDLVDPSKQEERKLKYLAAFERLKDMSMEDMQVQRYMHTMFDHRLRHCCCHPRSPIISAKAML